MISSLQSSSFYILQHSPSIQDGIEKNRIIATINRIGIVSGCVTFGDTVRCLNCRWEAAKDKNFVKKCTKHFFENQKNPKKTKKTQKKPKKPKINQKNPK